jgi:serine/threonine-protein kinase
MIAPRGRGAPAFLDEEEEVAPARERQLWPWLVAAAFVIAAIVAGFLVWHQLSGGGPKETVINYIGESVGQAERQIKDIHLNPVEKKQSCERYAPGQVCNQSPEAGGKVSKGGNVTLIVSTGKPKVAVPSVVGQPFAQAKAAFKTAGLKIDEHIVKGGKTKGIVSAVDPPAGKMIPKGSTVRVNVTAGPVINQVPSVVHETEQQAQADLATAGFNMVVAGYTNSNQPQNTVVSQDPQPGQSLAQGQSVKVTLSNGPPQKTVPSVVNETSEQATLDLENAGFKVKQVPTPTSDQTQQDIVQSQTPAGNSQAPQGSTVTIDVGQYQPGGTTTTIP